METIGTVRIGRKCDDRTAKTGCVVHTVEIRPCPWVNATANWTCEEFAGNY